MLRIQLTANKRRSRERERQKEGEGRRRRRKEAGQNWGARPSLFQVVPLARCFPQTQDRTTPNDAGIRKLVGPQPPPPSARATGETTHRPLPPQCRPPPLAPFFIYSGFLASALLAHSRHLLADSTNGSYPATPNNMQSEVPLLISSLHGTAARRRRRRRLRV